MPYSAMNVYLDSLSTDRYVWPVTPGLSLVGPDATHQGALAINIPGSGRLTINASEPTLRALATAFWQLAEDVKIEADAAAKAAAEAAAAQPSEDTDTGTDKKPALEAVR